MNAVFSFRSRMLACFAFTGAMIFVRIFLSGELHFIFLGRNIFLAWIPYAISRLFIQYSDRKSRMKLFVLMTAWLAFFPNALYILTDMIHLKQTDHIPVWYDAVLLFLSAATGLMLAFASLLKAEQALKIFIPEKHMNLSMVCLLFLGSFGVYIGRFLRWNSWSILTHPFSLANDILQRIIHPFLHIKTWCVSFFLTVFYCFAWYLIKATVHHIKSLK